MRLAQFLLLFRCEIPDVTDFGGVEGHFMTSEKDLARGILYRGKNTRPVPWLAAFFRRLYRKLGSPQVPRSPVRGSEVASWIETSGERSV